MKLFATIIDVAKMLTWLSGTFFDDACKRYLKANAFWTFFMKTADLAEPWCLGAMIAALAKNDTRSLWLAFAGIAVAHFLRSVFDWRGSRARELFIGQAIRYLDRGINQRFFEKDLGLHLEEHKLLSQASMEKGRGRAETLSGLINWWLLETSISLVMTFVVLCIISPMCALITFATVLVSVITSTIMNHALIPEADKVDVTYRKIIGQRDERWNGIERVATSNKIKEEIESMDDQFKEMIKSDRRVWLGFIDKGMLRNSITAVGLLAVIAYALQQTSLGAMNIPDFVAIASWTMIVIGQTHTLATLERQITWCIPSLRSMRQALELQPRVLESTNPFQIPAGSDIEVEIRGVTHCYKGSTAPTLNDLSFTIGAGQRVALIGPSGAGKSTLVRLILRYMDPTHGNIIINGHDLRNIGLSSWRKLTAYIPQRPQIFDGTLRENLLYALGKEEAAKVTDEVLWEVVNRFRVNFGARLTHGLETVVGKEGVQLSGGEAQRVMIAAAAMKRPRFLIVDEGTASLDAESQDAVQQALYELLKDGATALFIAHRLSTLRHCNHYVVVTGGSSDEPQVEATAPNMEELAKRSPTFRRLAELEGVNLGA
ncbi:MAG: ABC transporter ATP-binding protein [Patescibacteria group bacterium]